MFRKLPDCEIKAKVIFNYYKVSFKFSIFIKVKSLGMKKIWILFYLIIGSLNSYLEGQNSNFCGVNKLLEFQFNQDRRIKLEFDRKQKELNKQDSINSKSNYSNKILAATIYTIPVVFHVLHQYGAENISDAQIIDAVNILNRDYRKLNSDTAFIFPPFQAADARFEFRLATKDTLGNCTTGIIRHYDTNTVWSFPPVDTMYQYTWNSSKYLNIYVVKSIDGFSTGGYASVPGFNPSFRDVVVVMDNCIGSIGTSNSYNSRLLTHEIGHWFNLMHVWGSGQCGVSCGDDGVADTPITMGWTSCPTSSSLSAVCNPTITENFQNYMEYSRYCDYMFSAGQVNRMTTAITSTVSGRSNLWTNPNLIATGIISPISPCAPIADCYSVFGSSIDVYTVCVGQSLIFRDASYNGTVAAWGWSVTGGGIIASPTNSVTSISFPAIGIQTVSLMASNSMGSSITTKTIAVLNSLANITSSYIESFESPGLPPNFNIINLDNDITWSQTSLAATTGTNSYFIDGSLDAPGSRADLLETPTYDFLNNPGATFTFKYAYARMNTANIDVFKIQVSSNCGGSWTDIFIGSNTTLSTGSGGTTTTPFVPTPTQFKLYTLTSNPAFNPFKTQAKVQIRFYFKEDTLAGYGNNIFLDDINFTSPTGVNEITKSIGFNLYPNPTSGNVSIEFALSENSQIKYFITDIVGRVVEQVKILDLNPGKHKLLISEFAKLNTGIYFVNFDVNGQRILRKIIAE
jgi:hypothetical protein